MSKVSVIVPAYKVENYIDECILSIVGQTYKDLEIILVDDGSPDRCGQICDEWAKKDERIHVFHTENKGLCSARNLGTEKSSGEYIVFVDGDDWLSPDYIEKLFECISNTSADIAMCSSISEWQNVSRPASHLPGDEKIFSAEEFSKAFLVYLGAYSVVWNKMFHRKFLEEIKFESGRYFEDTYFIGDMMQKVKQIAYIPNTLYHYRMRKSSIINKDCSVLSVHMQETVKHLIQVYQGNEYLCYLAKKLQYNQMLVYYAGCPSEKRAEWKKELSGQRKELWRSKYCGSKFRLKMLLTSICPALYCKWMDSKKTVTNQYYE